MLFWSARKEKLQIRNLNCGQNPPSKITLTLFAGDVIFRIIWTGKNFDPKIKICQVLNKPLWSSTSATRRSSLLEKCIGGHICQAADFDDVKMGGKKIERYCWWKKSQTATQHQHVWNPANHGILSTYQLVQDFFHQQYHAIAGKQTYIEPGLSSRVNELGSSFIQKTFMTFAKTWDGSAILPDSCGKVDRPQIAYHLHADKPSESVGRKRHKGKQIWDEK